MSDKREYGLEDLRAELHIGGFLDAVRNGQIETEHSDIFCDVPLETVSESVELFLAWLEREVTA